MFFQSRRNTELDQPNNERIGASRAEANPSKVRFYEASYWML